MSINTKSRCNQLIYVKSFEFGRTKLHVCMDKWKESILRFWYVLLSSPKLRSPSLSGEREDANMASNPNIIPPCSHGAIIQERDRYGVGGKRWI